MGGHEFQHWPTRAIAGGFGGDLQARHRHDHTRLADQPFAHTHTAIRRADPERDAEEAFDQLNPGYGVPADQRHPLGRQAVRDREAALALGCGWPSMTAARTTGIRSSGSPARTTEPPTPSNAPVRSLPAPDGVQSGSAPNAEPAHARSR
jgi:hypothetical protein